MQVSEAKINEAFHDESIYKVGSKITVSSPATKEYMDNVKIFTETKFVNLCVLQHLGNCLACFCSVAHYCSEKYTDNIMPVNA